jgi:hypothetical protein
MWPYLQMWSPLYAVALGAAIYFSVVPLMMSLGKLHRQAVSDPKMKPINRH